MHLGGQLDGQSVPYITRYPSLQNPMFPQQQFYQQQDVMTKLFQPIMEATHSLYVDGVPTDTNEREVAHIFRPYPGFQRVRLIKKQTSKGREYFLCFVDFDDSFQASVAMSTLQGYRFDKADKQGLKVSFANNPKDKQDKKK